MKNLQHIFLTSLLLLTFTLTASAQTPYKKSAIVKELKSNMKEAAYSKVVNAVKNAFSKFPEQTSNDADFYYYNIQASNALALEEAKKMYLAQKADTMKYFDYIQTVFTDGLTCDSLANIPDQKGRVVNRYHKDINALFGQNMKKLPSAAKFAFQKKDYARAYRFADTYIVLNADSSAFSQKALSGEEATEVSPLSAITVLAAYAQNKFNHAVLHIDKALKENKRRRQLLEIACRCYDQLKDSVKLEKSLRDGVNDYPSDKFFFFTLVKLYNDQSRYNDALQLTSTMLQVDNQNRDFWYIRGKEEEYMGLEDDALKSFTAATELKTDDAESFSAIGNIYLNKSHLAYEQQKSATGIAQTSLKKELNALYTKAKDAFEQARKHDSQNTALWLSGLKELYYKLNMGKELKAIESLK